MKIPTFQLNCGILKTQLCSALPLTFVINPYNFSKQPMHVAEHNNLLSLTVDVGGVGDAVWKDAVSKDAPKPTPKAMGP